ncbi:protein tramtrack, beta isoform-like isoform X1 [Zophobas morio]|uniref:protein tramtrack, beta isoform-like isoform X1 n=2 Tax=Zophobas morio TaxID=2755281 RepID=UPI003082B2FA
MKNKFDQEMALADDQQFCLRWNNFQANITSQFEALRDDEDFTDVTIACEGQRMQAHKVVLSACSPFFKELFKANPCSHPIIFMRDVEAKHIVALMEFMYAGEVNVAQAHLSAFLKTAESLKIRGLTDTSAESDNHKEEDTLYLNPQPSKHLSATTKHKLMKPQISSSSTVTSSQDVSTNISSPPPKRQCKSESEVSRIRQIKDESMNLNPFALQNDNRNQSETNKNLVQPKMELPDYLSDDDGRDDNISNFYPPGDVTELPGGMEIIPQVTNFTVKDGNHDAASQGSLKLRRRRSPDHWLPFELHPQDDSPGDSSDLTMRMRDKGERRNRLIKLGEGIEIYEDQLRSVKWNDYRKLTRGLATILFSPAELATCSVTGQRWSRAGSGERPVKPALDRSKVQAIISYVATRFPMVEISRIKQVLAYKCKENSTAFKMKAVRYYEDQHSK